MAILLLTSASSCDRPKTASAAPGIDTAAYDTLLEDATTSRDSWLSLSDEPAVHMWWARDFLEKADDSAAATELEKCATLFRWGASHASGPDERDEFLATARELDSAAREVKSGDLEGGHHAEGVLDRGYRVLAAYHTHEALTEWEAGEHRAAAQLMTAASTEIEQGFTLSGAPIGTSIDEAVAEARSVALRLGTAQPPSEHEIRRLIDNLGRAVNALGSVLQSRAQPSGAVPTLP
jgi:hypothetical protein